MSCRLDGGNNDGLLLFGTSEENPSEFLITIYTDTAFKYVVWNLPTIFQSAEYVHKQKSSLCAEYPSQLV